MRICKDCFLRKQILSRALGSGARPLLARAKAAWVPAWVNNFSRSNDLVKAHLVSKCTAALLFYQLFLHKNLSSYGKQWFALSLLTETGGYHGRENKLQFPVGLKIPSTSLNELHTCETSPLGPWHTGGCIAGQMGMWWWFDNHLHLVASMIWWGWKQVEVKRKKKPQPWLIKYNFTFVKSWESKAKWVR